jgi:hypothetical protein
MHDTRCLLVKVYCPFIKLFASAVAVKILLNYLAFAHKIDGLTVGRCTIRRFSVTFLSSENMFCLFVQLSFWIAALVIFFHVDACLFLEN